MSREVHDVDLGPNDLVLLPPEMQKAPFGDGIKDHTLSIVHAVKALQGKARLACVLIERWGLVAGEIDGEDTAGRSKLRRLSPQELAEQACETAECAWKEFEARGWLLDIPLPTKIKKAETADADA